MNTADYIKKAITTRAFAQHLGLHVDRNGGMLCPFHGDKNKSLRVYADPTRGWYCFGCNRGGSVIDFAMEYYGVPYKESLQMLAAEFGLDINQCATPQARALARVELKKRRKEEQQRQIAINRARAALEQAEAELSGILSMMDENRPKNASEGISWLFVEAVNKKLILEQRWLDAQIALEAAERGEQRADITAR